jgi:hypothetical protein
MRPTADRAVAQTTAPLLEGALPIGSRALLLGWRSFGEQGWTRRWRALEAGVGARPPRAALSLPGADGASCLHLLMTGLPRTGRLTLATADGAASLPCDLASAPPLALAELARTLDHAHRRRLASWLLGVCPALFRLGDEPDLGFLTRDLVHAVLPAVGLGTALRRCRMLGHWTLLETMVPGGFGPRVDAYLLGGSSRVRHLVTLPTATTTSGPCSLYLGLEDSAPGENALLVLVGSGGVACRRLPRARVRLPAAAEWVNAMPLPQRAAARAATVDLAALLAEKAGSPPGLASLGAEIGLFSPLPPSMLPGGIAASLGAVVAAGRQLILAGTLDDPGGVVASFRLRRLGASPADFRRPHWVTGPAGEGRGGQAFVAAATMPAGPGNPHAPWRAVLVLRSGAELPLDEVPAAAVADPLPHLLAAAGYLAEVPAALELIEPAVRQLATDRAARCRIASIQLLGPPLLRPRASLALPFRCATDVERVVAMLGAEREGGSVELVLVALEGDGSTMVEAAALAARYARSIRAVLPDGSLTRAAVPHLALEATETPILVMLGSGVVPRVRGWLDTLLVAVEAGPSAAPGGALALAGLQLSGMGGSTPLPSLDAAAALRRDALACVGGLPLGWLDPEHRDADLTLQLLAARYRARVLAAPCCVRFAGIEPPWGEPATRLATALDTRRLAARAASYRRAMPATAGSLDADCPLAIAI